MRASEAGSALSNARARRLMAVPAMYAGQDP